MPGSYTYRKHIVGGKFLRTAAVWLQSVHAVVTSPRTGSRSVWGARLAKASDFVLLCFFWEFQDVSASRFTYKGLVIYTYVFILFGLIVIPKACQGPVSLYHSPIELMLFFWGPQSQALCTFQTVESLSEARDRATEDHTVHPLSSSFWMQAIESNLEMNKSRVITALMDSDRYLPEVLLFRCHGTKWRHGKTASRKPAVSHDPMRCRGYFGKAMY